MPLPVRKTPMLTLVVPVHNETGSIEPFLSRTVPILKGLGDYEILFVDDGSTDATLAELVAAHKADPHVRIVALSRNFGKDTALAAGLAHATGHAVIPIDVDLQDPPEVIPEMVTKWREGFDVVNARRADRSSDTWLKRTTAKLFYQVFNQMADRPILENVGDFRLLDRRVVDVLNRFPERARFMKGLFSWVGFSHCTIDYQRANRHAGESKWKYWKLWNFAVDGIASFTTVPLRIWTYFGAVTALLAFVYAAVLVVRTLIFGIDTPGYASLMVVVLFMGGINLLSLGVIGEYLGRTYTEVKGRPLYIVDRTWGFEPTPRAPRRAPSRK
ncbi:MAG: glycosyltransferase family 2 protein [Parcubacteria group bacterium]